MAKKSLIAKQKLTPKFSTRTYNRCRLCGRSRGFMGDFGLCRLCFRKLAHKGMIPGITKSSF